MRDRITRRIGAVVAATVVAAGLSVVATAAPAQALDNGLAKTPPMGFNDWNSFGCNVDEQLIKQTADFFVSSGLKDAGYQYVNIDDCWLTHSRDANGRLVPDPVKFPDGIKGTADYVHSKGLKLGIYEDAGTATCAGYPGSLGHEKVDAQTFADWGVDYLKYDNCNNAGSTTKEQYIQRYTAMRDALAATGRPIVYSLCEWGVNEPWTWGADVGNLWRTTGDISDNWNSLKSIIEQNAPLAQYAHPGAWNDPDMLEVGNGGMTDTEYKTHFGLWAEMSAPLLIGSDLRKATPATMAILSNKDVIAIDQDPLGKPGAVIAQNNGTMVFNKQLANGDRAVALYNSNDASATISTTTAALGLSGSPAYTVKDLWSGTTSEVADTITASVPAHGTTLLRVHADHNWADYPPASSIGVSSPSGFSGGDVAVPAGGGAPFTSTLTNSGQVPLENVQVSGTAPSGWTLTPTTATGKGALTSDRTFATGWTVGVPNGTAPGSYSLTITANYSWDDGTRPASVQSKAVVLVAAPPPSGSTPLSDVTWVSAANGWGPPEKDMSNGETAAGDGHPITIRGNIYPKGLGVHATSDIVYYLGGNCSSLRSDVGIDDETNGNGEVTFQVFAGDTKVADSGAVTGTSPAKTLTADLTGATWLRLHVDPDGANTYDHSDWAGPVLTCS
ncbi:MAG TPA: NPCBM/NEW2 domain-containing protein [Jatrophihabitantaceae bacterium]|jgi:alpha-galactosidase